MKKTHINQAQSRKKRMIFFIQLLPLLDKECIPAEYCITQSVVKWLLIFFVGTFCGIWRVYLLSWLSMAA